MHARSAVALGADVTRSPLAQMMCGRQKPLPAAGWKLAFPHGSHAAAFSVAENCPAAHFAHELPSMNVPGLQVPQ